MVSHALILNEQAETLKTVLETFKVLSSMEDEDIKTIIIDKDFSEIRALKSVIPDVKLIICKFHLKQAFERQVKKFSKNVKDPAMTILEKMCLSKTAEDYQRYVEEMRAQCHQVKKKQKKHVAI